MYQRGSPKRLSVPLAIAAMASASLLALAPAAEAEKPSSDALAKGFETPPNSARPRVWWHWMNGNITKDGIQKDLEWMSRVGIGGLQNFDAALETPQIVPHRLAYMTPEWKDAFRFAATKADSLGLEFAIAGSPGWSESGGPWVPPQDGMKKLVWSETLVEGGRPVSEPLDHPPTLSGPYQTLAVNRGAEDAEAGAIPSAYGAVAVLAVPVSPQPPLPRARVTVGSGQEVDPQTLLDPAGRGVEIVRGSSASPAVVTLRYDGPQTIRSAVVFLPGSAQRFRPPLVAPTLEARLPDGSWTKVADVPMTFAPTTVSFQPVTAQVFRLVIHPTATNADDGLAGVGLPGVATPDFGSPPGPNDRLSLLQLSPEARVNRFEAKAGFSTSSDYYALDKSVGADVAGVDPDKVIDLSDKLQADGRLVWTPPPGTWKILRLGWSLEGVTNHPATREATGLEVDEYDGAAVRRYIDTYLGMYAATLGPDLMGAHGLRAQINDSTEVGASNWTPALLAQFRRLRGYDATPWLPALTGVVVGSRARSDAFLYDFRRTLSDLVSSEHYKTITQAVHEHGMLEYGEALEARRVVLGDDMTMRSFADVPMAALWAYNPAVGPRGVYLADMKGASSTAHVYGRSYTAAESMTSARAPWAFAPWQLKQYIDLEFLMGVNRPVIHTSVHQPVDDKVPGLSLSIFGQFFTRHESWAEMARPWIDYISRTAFLLQQGRDVADVAYFYGEEAPLVPLYDAGLPTDAPSHYGYDFVSPDVVAKEITVSGGDLVTRGGARYKVLYLGGSTQRMTLGTLRRLADLVEAGATVVGLAPISSPSLQDDPAAFAALVKRLWGGGPTTTVGKGKVVATRDVEAVLRANGVAADFSVSGGGADNPVRFVHRRAKEGDIYFVDNRGDRPVQVDARFRATGKAPEIWHAESGRSEPVSYSSSSGATVAPLALGPQEAVFVVFRKPGPPARALPSQTWRPVAQLTGGWNLSFQQGRGAPSTAHLDQLQSLSENKDPRIKYFSGTVSYVSSFDAPPAGAGGRRLMLDLGDVGDIADVWVNGHHAGYAWKAPWRVPVGSLVRPGHNRVEVRVANVWVNRLIGDAQPGVTSKVTYTTIPTYRPDAPLRPAGLMGPVTLLASAPSSAPRR